MSGLYQLDAFSCYNPACFEVNGTNTVSPGGPMIVCGASSRRIYLRIDFGTLAVPVGTVLQYKYAQGAEVVYARAPLGITEITWGLQFALAQAEWFLSNSSAGSTIGVTEVLWNGPSNRSSEHAIRKLKSFTPKVKCYSR